MQVPVLNFVIEIRVEYHRLVPCFWISIPLTVVDVIHVLFFIAFVVLISLK